MSRGKSPARFPLRRSSPFSLLLFHSAGEYSQYLVASSVNNNQCSHSCAAFLHQHYFFFLSSNVIYSNPQLLLLCLRSNVFWFLPFLACPCMPVRHPLQSLLALTLRYVLIQISYTRVADYSICAGSCPGCKGSCYLQARQRVSGCS